MEEAKGLGQEIGLPELGPLSFMAEAMNRLGPVKSDGMGLRPADWQEIDPFIRQTRRISGPWECEALFDMCASYFQELKAGEGVFTIPPVERAGNG
jgi:hypothetical protein